MSPETRKSQLADLLRTQIVSGQYLPGSRLPTRAELLEGYSASNTTVQQALDELQQDGFVEARGRAGTFVAQSPPHLTRYGIGYMSQPGWEFEPWSLFHQAINLEANFVDFPGRQHFVSYYNLFDRSDSNAAHQELLEDVTAQRLAGLILVGQADLAEYKSRGVAPEIPRICLGESGNSRVPSMVVDSQAWQKRAVHELVRRGRKRIALIEFQAQQLPFYDTTQYQKFSKVVQEAGAQTDQSLYLPIGLFPQTAAQFARLLVSLPAGLRPDGLILNDDNLVEAVSYALSDCGITLGQEGEMDVVAHGNFPRLPKVSLPIHFLGYDVRWILAHAVAFLEEQRQIPVEQRPQNYSITVPLVNSDLCISSGEIYSQIQAAQ